MNLAQLRSRLLRAPAAFFGRLMRPLPDARLARILYAVVRGLAHGRPPASSLRFLLRLDNHLRDLIGQESSRYGGGANTKHRHTRYHDFFCDRLVPGERVLDIGSGIGILARSMAEKSGAVVTGIEIDSANFEHARRHYPHERVRYLLGDARRDLPPERFDTVVISNVLEHIEDRVGLLRDVQARCQPRRWLIRVPVYERDWTVPLKDELGVDSRLDDTHFIEYREGDLPRELAAAGLAPVELRTIWGEIWCEARPAPGAQ